MARKLTKSTKITSDVKKLKLLFTIVDRNKTLFYLDQLEQYEVNMQVVCYGSGTAEKEMLNLLGLAKTEKSVILSMIREDLEKDILNMLDEKFKKVKNGKGIAFTIPFKSIIGVAAYQFLSNNTTYLKEEKTNE